MSRSKKGFTLIELLVVIAIIAILAAILFPVFATTKERARQTKCVNNLKQLALAFNQYAADFNGQYPSAGDASTGMGVAYPSGPEGNYAGVSGWGLPAYLERGQLWRYTRNRELYLCPTDKGRAADILLQFQPTKYPLSYPMNYSLSAKKVDAVRCRMASKLMLLIHEKRGDINDAIYQSWNVPDNIHYDGTTVAYVDGHARWGKAISLQNEINEGYWIAH